MKQPIKKNIKYKDKTRGKNKTVKKKQLPGTSKLETYFAENFLDKLEVKYIYQFEAKDIKRFYDFFLEEENLIIEIDGDYFHCNPEKYKDGPINKMQQRNKRIDEIKDKWALSRGIPILRIWENDIRNNPSKVMKLLKENIRESKELFLLKEKKKIRPKIKKL